MIYGTVESIAKKIIDRNEIDKPNILNIIPDNILSTEVTDGNYEEIIKNLDDIRHAQRGDTEKQFLFNVAATIGHL